MECKRTGLGLPTPPTEPARLTGARPKRGPPTPSSGSSSDDASTHLPPRQFISTGAGRKRFSPGAGAGVGACGSSSRSTRLVSLWSDDSDSEPTPKQARVGPLGTCGDLPAAALSSPPAVVLPTCVLCNDNPVPISIPGAAALRDRPPPPTPTVQSQGIIEVLLRLTSRPPPAAFHSETLWDIARVAGRGLPFSVSLNNYIREVFFVDSCGSGGGPQRVTCHGGSGVRAGCGGRRWRHRFGGPHLVAGVVPASRSPGRRTRGPGPPWGHGRRHEQIRPEAPAPRPPLGRRARRRQEYARTQDQFHLRQSQCARRILDGDKRVSVPDPEAFLHSWERVMCPPLDTLPSLLGELPSSGSAEVREILFPVSAQEIKASLPPRHSAPGPDGFSP